MYFCTFHQGKKKNINLRFPFFRLLLILFLLWWGVQKCTKLCPFSREKKLYCSIKICIFAELYLNIYKINKCIINKCMQLGYICNQSYIQFTILNWLYLIVIKLCYMFLAKQEISEAYTNVPAKTHVIYFISMSVCLSFCGTFLCTVVWENYIS